MALQTDAGALWAGLRALAALSAKIERETPPQPNAGHPWGDDYVAARHLAASLEQQAGRLTSRLDSVAIERGAGKGAAA